MDEKTRAIVAERLRDELKRIEKREERVTRNIEELQEQIGIDNINLQDDRELSITLGIYKQGIQELIRYVDTGGRT